MSRPPASRARLRNLPGPPPGRRRRALYLPRAARVSAGAGGVPVEVDGRPIEAVRESWLVEDRWWSERPLRRRYWELVTGDGRNLVVFHDLESGRWFAQT